MRPLNLYMLAIVFVVPSVLTLGTPTKSEAPAELGNPVLAALGFVDVTATPFSADPRGKRDSTEALQRAIDFARDHQMVCFFPPGRYKISDTLNCEQFRPLRRDGRRQGTRDYPCVLRGSQRGRERPRIVLASRSEGFSDPGNPKYVIRFWAPGAGTETPIDQPQPNISMNQMLVGIADTFFAGDGTDPRRWHMVREDTAAGETVETPPLDRPVLYKRGSVSEASTAANGGHNASATPIKPYLKDPSYWEYHGRPIALVGGSDCDNIFQWVLDGTRLTDHLDLLVACGGNYIRCTMSSREYTSEGYRWDLLPYPFAKIGDKYDLEQWDDVYWNKLRMFLRETKKRGIIVQLEIWDRWNESGDSRKARFGWYDSPWNPNNNSTYDWADSPLLKPGKTDFYNSFHYAAVTNDPVLLPLQQRFVEKVVDEVLDNGNDHVLFQVDNESGIGDETLEPDPYWARFVRHYAKSKGASDIFVCSSRRFHLPTPYEAMTFQDWDNPEVRVPLLNEAFNFSDISQNNGSSGQTQYDNILWYRSRVLAHGVRPVNNVKCYHFNWPIGGSFGKDRTSPTDAEAGAKFWRAVFAGSAGIRFHRHTPTRPAGLREGFGLTPEGQRHLRSMREFLDAVQIFRMNPRNDLLSQRVTDEAYCLAEPGQQYAVFFTGNGDGRMEIELTASGHSFDLCWLDITTSCWSPRAAVSSRGGYVLRAPDSGHWVAVLRAAIRIE